MYRLCLVLWFCLLPAAWAAPMDLRVATFNVENYIDAGTSTRRAKSAALRGEGSARAFWRFVPMSSHCRKLAPTNALFQLEGSLKAGGLDLPFWEQVAAYDTNIHLSILSRFPIVSRREHTNESFRPVAAAWK